MGRRMDYGMTDNFCALEEIPRLAANAVTRAGNSYTRKGVPMLQSGCAYQ